MDIGQRFGRLTVVRFAEKRPRPNGKHRYRWLCKCDCGTDAVVDGTKLTSGHTSSCGCYRRDQCRDAVIAAVTTHGMSYSPEYKAWKSMRDRVDATKGDMFRDYGARGIKLCDEWRESFSAFYEHIGPRPSLNHSVDRWPDNDGNYEPGNVRWATREQQMHNTRRSMVVEAFGEIKALAAFFPGGTKWPGYANAKYRIRAWPDPEMVIVAGLLGR